MKSFLLSLLIFTLHSVFSANLAADCDMMALISLNSKGLSATEQVNGDFNDPSDYFSFLRSRSGTADSDFPLNNDGYGLLYYRYNDPVVIEKQMFYKTGFDVWYEGLHDEPLDIAETSMMNPENRAGILLGHARHGTGGYGSHPFTLVWHGRTYSFMHNGSVSSTAKNAFMLALGRDWFEEYPSNWLGMYGDVRSFIDSELYFHFIMSKVILHGGNVPVGIQTALNSDNVNGVDFRWQVFNALTTLNFVMSDGINLYIFRNSPSDPTLHNLSYNIIDNHFIGVKTQETIGTAVRRNELVVIDHLGNITIMPMELTLPVELTYFTGSVAMDGSVLMRWQTASETGLSGFNIYRGNTSSFTNATKLNTSLISPTNNAHGSTYQYVDTETTPGSVYRYWLECIESDGSSPHITSTVITIPYHENTGNPPITASSLLQNFPNPFYHGDATIIPVKVMDGDAGELVIYNLKGQKVIDFKLNNGSQNLTWNGYDEHGNACAPGIYFARLKTKDTIQIKKLVIAQ